MFDDWLRQAKQSLCYTLTHFLQAETINWGHFATLGEPSYKTSFDLTPTVHGTAGTLVWKENQSMFNKI